MSKEIVILKKRICGVVAQHVWELSPLLFQKAGDEAARAALLERLESLIKTERVERFVVLIERGLPLDIVSALLALRDTLGTELECVIPYEEQHIAWPEEEQERYFTLISMCDKEYMVQHPFSLDCYQKSMKYLLSCCDYFLIIWNGRPSDAGDAVQMVRRRHLPFQVLDPSHLQGLLH